MTAAALGVIVVAVAAAMGERSALWLIAAPFLLAAVLSFV